jgi:hypothetical protein
MKLLFMQFLPACLSFVLGPNILAVYSQTPTVCCERSSFHPYKTTGKMIVLCI